MSPHLPRTTFGCMGCAFELRVDDERAAAAVRGLLEAIDARLSRFRPDSELSALNRDPRTTVPASPLLRRAVAAALWAAARSHGLVDPTLLPALERLGYRGSRAHAAPASLDRARAAAPPPRAARAHPDGRWRAIAVDDDRGTIVRPAGLRLDTGATTKGLAADVAARLLADRDRYVVDCAGDLRVRAPRPIEVRVEHPLTHATAHTLLVAGGGVATSGIGRRIWLRGDGRVAHHLLDPSTGEPAWSGLLQVTALAAGALHAETLAKHALLAGAPAARRLLARRGGVLVHDDGTVELVGRAARRARLGGAAPRARAPRRRPSLDARGVRPPAAPGDRLAERTDRPRRAAAPNGGVAA